MRRKDVIVEFDDKTKLPNYRYYGKKHGSVILEFIGVILTTILMLAYVGLFSFIFFVTISSIYLYVGVLIPTIITVIFISVLLYLLFNRIIKRPLFMIKLNRVCKKHNYIVEFYVDFFRSLFFKSNGYHFGVETARKIFFVRYLASYNYNSELIFRSAEKVALRTNIGAHRNNLKLALGIKEKYKIRPFSLADEEENSRYKEVVKVILMNPVPREAYYIKDGAKIPTGSGDKLFGHTLYSGSDFITVLEKADI